MAYPPEHKTPRLEYLSSLINTSNAFDACEKLCKEDIYVIGCLIQTFNFIELNLRRALALFQAHGQLGLKPKSVHSSELILSIQTAVRAMDGGVENINDSVAKLDEMERGRLLRNALAHCAALRIKGEDALVLFTSDSKDIKKIVGKSLDHNSNAFMVMDLADLRGLVIHFSTYENWIALKIPEWFLRYDTNH